MIGHLQGGHVTGDADGRGRPGHEDGLIYPTPGLREAEGTWGRFGFGQQGRMGDLDTMYQSRQHALVLVLVLAALRLRLQFWLWLWLWLWL